MHILRITALQRYGRFRQTAEELEEAMEIALLVINQIPSASQYEVIYALFKCATYKNIIDWLASDDDILHTNPTFRKKKYAALRQLKRSAMTTYEGLLTSLPKDATRRD